MTDRAQGGTVYDDGLIGFYSYIYYIELMLNRVMTQDDHKGLGAILREMND